MNEPSGEARVREAQRLLTEAERTGRLADRDAGIAAALQIFHEAHLASPELATLAVATARALRRRWWTLYAPADLDTAVGLLTSMETALGGDPRWASVAAELARSLVDIATGLLVGSFPAPEGVEASRRATEVAAHAAQLARGAVAATAGRSQEAEADAAYALGSALWALNDLGSARAWLARSVERAPRIGARYLLARTLATLYDEGKDPKDLIAAQEELDELTRIDEPPRETFEAARFRAFWATERGDWSEAAAASLRALDLREQLRQDQGEEFRERQWLVEVGRLPSLAAYALTRAGRLPEAVAALDAALFTEITDRLGGSPQTRPDFEMVAGVAADELLVYLVVTRRGGLALVVAGTKVIPLDLPALTTDTLHQRHFAYQDAYRKWQRTQSPDGLGRWKVELESLSAWLWSAVMAPVLEALPPGADAVTLVPDGIVGLLPLHAANGDGVSALDRVQLRLAPNARALAAARQAAGGAAGDPVLVAAAEVPGMQPLRYATAEVYGVASVVGKTKMLTGAQTTVSAVERSMQGGSLIHLACHGLARSDDPRLSAVFLTDGELSLARLLQLRLPSTRLVLLSACESGLSEIAVPEEKASLPAGLMLAGAAGVVASLWAVNDRSTMLLMVRFHELTAAGTPPCAALRAAQRWLRDSATSDLARWAVARAETMAAAHAPPEEASRLANALRGLERVERPFAHPYHWAGFTYFGE